MSAQNHLDILSNRDINQEYVINVTKENIDSVNHKTKKKCKILKFSSNWNFEEIVAKIPTLDAKSFPLLFTFVIDIKANDFCGSVKFLKSSLAKFIKSRPMVLQLTSSKENSTKMYYKDGDCNNFCEVNGEAQNVTDFNDFSSFLWLYFNGKIDNFEEVMLKKLPNVKNSVLILRFLRCMKLLDDFLYKIILKCAAYGSVSNLLAAINGFLDAEGKINDTEFFLSTKIYSKSILYTAVRKSNQLILNFLLKKCSHLINQLPVYHQKIVSTEAHQSRQLSVFCYLLEYCDFPFPKNFNPEIIDNDRLRKIVDDRIEFHANIINENRAKIRDFIDNYTKLKFAFNLENKSAIGSALNKKKFESFTFLKANRFRDNEIENINIKNLSEENDRTNARNYAFVQTKKNVNISTFDEDVLVQQLAMRSLIYNRDEINPLEQEQREIIKKWYSEIYKIDFVSKLIDAAAQCKDLKIIFDFECESTENVDVLSTSGSLGVTFPASKWIFIGAKLTGSKQREQKIKGVIAHETCHYVMRLVYQNKENPYYEYDKEHCAEFEVIVKEIRAMLFPEQKKDEEHENAPEAVDDKCDGTISTVYTLYDENDWHPELIVRPAHIQAQFDDNQEKIKELEEMYKKLFDFFEQFVLPEIERFCLQNRANIQIFNDFIGIICDLKNSPIKLQTKDNLNELFSNKSSIITTNVPKLLLLDIYNHVAEKYKDLLDVKNIFITPEILKNSSFSKKFDNILKENSNLNIFVNCTKECETSYEINAEEGSKVYYITSNDNQNESLVSKIMKQGTSPVNIAIDYNWIDLTPESQILLLQSKINFQNKSTFSLSELILNEVDSQQLELNDDLKIIIDDKLLNSLVHESEIKINQIVLENVEDKKFRTLFQTRHLIKKYKIIEKIKTLDQDDMTNVQIHKEHSDIRLFNVESLTNDETTAQLETELSKNNNIGEANFNINQGMYGKSMKQLKEIERTEELTQEQMLEDVKNKKFVLISDKAGSGKSWILKNFTNKLRDLYPNRWTTYIDLKQFIQEFKVKNTDLEFAVFMVEKILKVKSNYEAEIFKKLYQIGKVCIIFDAFDEVAPDCAEFVTNLFQSFQQNGRNQLWIATRDFFEVDLKEKLELEVVYKLDVFTEVHGVELIASSWILTEIIQDAKTLIQSDVENSQNLQEYKEIARKIIEKIPKTENNSIGLPQFYKMIADITQDNKNTAIDFTTFKIFEECVEIQCKKWSHEKGELRTNESIQSQEKELNYQKLHELVAIKSLFPDDSEFCDLIVEDLEQWIDEEIIACGMLTKKGEIFLFSHETFREYFVAKFILRILMKAGKRDDDQVCGYLIQILTIEKFGIIRMFLNEAFGDQSALMKTEKKIPKINEIFCKNAVKLENLKITFEENHENLAYFLLKILKNGNYEQVNYILWRNKNILLASRKNIFFFNKVQQFVMNFFTPYDFRNFIFDYSIILEIFDLSLGAETITKFIEKTKEKTDLNFVKKSLQMQNEIGENLFFYLIRSKNFSSKSFHQVTQILKTYLNMNEIIELIKEYNKKGWNILHECVWLKNASKLETLWNLLELLFKSQNISDEFKKFVNQKMFENNYNMLHLVTLIEEITFHETLWKLLLTTFDNYEELKDLSIQRDNAGDNYVHRLITNTKPEIIEFTLRKIKENFINDHYEEILKSKGHSGRDLLQAAACYSKHIKTHQILWKIFRDFYKSDREFLEFVKEVDVNGSNIFHLAVSFTSNDIFEFMINELEKIASNKEIENILRTFGNAKTNLLQSALTQNESFELHQYLWTVIHKYFNSKGILDMIQHFDEFGSNYFLDFLGVTTKEILELTWNEIKIIFELTENSSTIHEYLSRVSNDQENILHVLIKSKDIEKLKYFWTELENHFTKQQLRELLCQKTSKYKQNVLHYALNCKEIKFHETLWDLLLETFENRDELKNLIKQADENGNNFVQFLVIHNIPEIIYLTLRKIKENFSNDQCEEILNCKGFLNRSLLQAAAIYNKSFEVNQSLWKICREYFDDSQMFNIINHTDENGNNLFIDAIICNKKEVVMFIWNQIKIIFIRAEHFNQKWSYRLIKCEKYLNLLLENPSFKGKMEPMKIKWNELVKELELLDAQKHFERILNKKLSGKSITNLYHLASCDKLEQHEDLWENLLNCAQNKEVLKNLMLKKDFEGNNFLHILVLNDNPDIIEFTFSIFINNFRNDQYEEVIKSKGQFGRNLLQHAACETNHIKTHQILWKIFRDFYKSDREFLEFLKEVDVNGSNVFDLAAAITSKEIFEFMINEADKIASSNEIRNILRLLGMQNKNIMQSAARQNKLVELRKYLWTITIKYFNTQEVLDMIYHLDESKNNHLFNAVEFNTKQFLELTWNEIKIIFELIETNSTIHEYLSRVNNDQENIIHVLIKSKDVEKLKYFWTELEIYFTKQQLRELLCQKTSKYKQNVLHYALNCKEIKFHETLWELLLNTFENREDLKDLIKQANKDKINFIHYILALHMEADITEFYFHKIKEVFDDDQFEEVLNCKHLNRSLLHCTVVHNKSFEVNQSLWKICREYFDDSQMFNIINHTDENGNNLFMDAIICNTKEVVMFIWNQIKGILIHAEYFNQKLSNHLNECEEYLLTIFKNSSDNKKIKTMKLKWNRLAKESELIDSQMQIERILSNELSVKEIKNLYRLALCDKLEQHEALWDILLNSTENKEELKELMLKTDLNGNNLLHLLVSNDNPDIFKFTLNILKTNFSDEQFQEILKTKGEFGRNLLQIALNSSKKVKTHQVLSKIYRDSCKSDQIFLELLKDVDTNGSNVFHLAASSSTAKFFDFMLETLKKSAKDVEIKNLLTTSGFWNENILQIASISNNSLQLHQKLWEIIQKYFDSTEILEMIHHCDRDGDNILQNAVFWNTKEIVDFTWKQIKKFIQIKENQIEFLNRKGHHSSDLLQMSLENQVKDPKVRTWVQNIMKKYQCNQTTSIKSNGHLGYFRIRN